MESDGSEGALDITGEDVSEENIGTENRLLNAYGSLVVVRGQNFFSENRAAAIDVKSMSLNLATLSIAWEETSTFRSY